MREYVVPAPIGHLLSDPIEYLKEINQMILGHSIDCSTYSMLSIQRRA